jgi:predicted TPR repeat methyltransferase
MANLLNQQLYDEFADEYAAHSESSAYNAHYERPAMLELLGDPRGKSILDIGCGAAPLLRILSERGARQLAGIEASSRLADIARTRVPDGVTIYNGEIQETLSTLRSSIEQDVSRDGGRFDVVIASLVLHYIDPLEPLFKLVASVLVDGGRFLFSTNVPAKETAASYVVEERWTTFGLDVARYEQSEETLWQSLSAAGFDILGMTTPRPLETMRDVNPRAYALVCMQPAFLFIEATRVQPGR